MILTPKDIERFWAKVDKADGFWVWTASTKANGYGSFWVKPRTRFAHRVAWEIANGEIPAGMKVDHTCFNHLCVRVSHMRLATQKQNQENLSGLKADNTSGARGVHWCRQKRKWKATVIHDGRIYHGGFYLTVAEADQAAINLRNQLFTHNLLDRAA